MHCFALVLVPAVCGVSGRCVAGLKCLVCNVHDLCSLVMMVKPARKHCSIMFECTVEVYTSQVNSDLIGYGYCLKL